MRIGRHTQRTLGGDHRERSVACMVRACAIAVSMSLSGSHNSVTRPAASARAASMGSPGQDHLRGERGTDDGGKPLRTAATGQAADADLGQGEARAGSGNPQVAGESELEPATEGQAVDGGNHRLAELVQRLDDARPLRIGRRRGGRSPPAQNALPAPVSTTTRTDGSASKGRRPGQFRAHVIVDGVTLVRPGERDPGDRILDVNCDRAQ